MSAITDWLDERDRLASEATEGPWVVSLTGASVRDDPTGATEAVALALGTRPSARELANFPLIADARTSLPQAVAALRKVLELHHTGQHEDCAYHEPGWRKQRCHHDGELWPCSTARTIAEALGVDHG